MKYAFVLFVLLISCHETTPPSSPPPPVVPVESDAKRIDDIARMQTGNIKKAYVNGWWQGASAAITLYNSKNFNKQAFDLLLLRDSLAFANLVDRK